MKMRNKRTYEQDQFLIDNVKGITLKELTRLFNEKFNLNLSESAIANRKNKLGLRSGVNFGAFKKGNVPFNKGTKGLMKANKTSFKKGNVPQNYRAVGSERVTKDGYIEIKVADPSKWQPKHRCIYEKHYGPIPEGYNVMFADKNKRNFDIDNLILVSKNEDLIMNNNKLFYEDKELTKTGHLIAKVMSKTSELKRRSNERGKNIN